MFAGQSYSVKSDQENGLGRTDIVVKDKKTRRPFFERFRKEAAVCGNRLNNEKFYDSIIWYPKNVSVRRILK